MIKVLLQLGVNNIRMMAVVAKLTIKTAQLKILNALIRKKNK